MKIDGKSPHNKSWASPNGNHPSNREKKHISLIPSDTRNFPEGVIIDKSLKKLTCTNFLGKKNYGVALRRRASPI